MEAAAMCEAAAMVKDEEMMGKDEKEINHQWQQQHGRDSLKVHNKKDDTKLSHFHISASAIPHVDWQWTGGLYILIK